MVLRLSPHVTARFQERFRFGLHSERNLEHLRGRTSRKLRPNQTHAVLSVSALERRPPLALSQRFGLYLLFWGHLFSSKPTDSQPFAGIFEALSVMRAMRPSGRSDRAPWLRASFPREGRWWPQAYGFAKSEAAVAEIESGPIGS